MQKKILNKLLNEEELTTEEISSFSNSKDVLAILNCAIYYLTKEKEENAFDILLEEFFDNAKKSDLKIGFFALETLILNEKHKNN